MFDWIVLVDDHEYRFRAPHRWIAINRCVNLYKEETGSTVPVAILMAVARGYKIGRGKRGG